MIWAALALAILLWAGATIGREIKLQLDQASAGPARFRGRSGGGRPMAIDRRAAYYRKLPHQHDPENFLARYDRGLQLQAKWRSGSWRRA